MEEELLKQEERLDDLGFQNLKIIQNKKWFCFGIDSVLLSNFAKNIKKESTVLDLGTGTGIIPTLFCGKTKLKKVYGIEIQPEVAEMAKRSCKYNKLEEKFEIINDSILNLSNYFEKHKFDVVVTNPPYKKKDTGIINESDTKTISRHEITANLEEFIKVASEMLKDNGEFYMVHHPERLVDICCYMRKYKIEPKEIQFVFSKEKQIPKLILIKGVKLAKEFLKVLPNLYIYNEDGTYTDEIKRIYGEENN